MHQITSNFLKRRRGVHQHFQQQNRGARRAGDALPGAGGARCRRRSLSGRERRRLGREFDHPRRGRVDLRPSTRAESRPPPFVPSFLARPFADLNFERSFLGSTDAVHSEGSFERAQRDLQTGCSSCHLAKPTMLNRKTLFPECVNQETPLAGVFWFK